MDTVITNVEFTGFQAPSNLVTVPGSGIFQSGPIVWGGAIDYTYDPSAWYTPIPGPVFSSPFESGVLLTGAPVSVSGSNQNSIVVGAMVQQWWHWTAPSDGVAELNAAPLYQFDTSVQPPGPPTYHISSTWPQVSTGPDANHLTPVPLLGFSRSTVITPTFAPMSPPLFLPEDRLPWQHKFRFPVTAGETYHIALSSAANGPYQFVIDLYPFAMETIVSSTNPLVGDPFPVEFVSSDTNYPVTSLQGFAGFNLLGGSTNEPFNFVFTPSQSGLMPIFAFGTNNLGQRVVSHPALVMVRPANDDFARATTIASNLSQGSFSNNAAFATAEPGEPDVNAGLPAAHSVWWRWTAHYGVQTTVTLQSPLSRLAIYKGEDLASLQRVGELQSDTNYYLYSLPWVPPVLAPPYPTMSFMAEPGVTYYFQADGSDIVSWSLDQKTLEFYPGGSQHVNVGWPVDLSAFFYETDQPPFHVDFFLGQQIWNVWGNTNPVTIGMLGSFDSPPLATNWVPANTGLYFAWARSTNHEGIVHESGTTPFLVYAQNDDFDRAMVIQPDTTVTNFTFGTIWASVETNEPPHKLGAARVTRWWKWTPSYSGTVRIKAVRNQQGLLVEAFSGTGFNDLRLLADNRRTVSITGMSGAIHLRVRSGKTYYIRTDEDPRLPLPVSAGIGGTETPANILTIEPANTPLPGEISSSLIVGVYPTSSGIVPVAMARVYQSDGKTPVLGEQYQAQLYAGRTASELLPVGEPSPFYPDFYSGYGPPPSYYQAYAGIYLPRVIVLPAVNAGDRICAQIRVWDSNFGQSFEAAAANGGPVGASKIVNVVAGSEETGPAMLLGIKNFKLQNTAP